MNPNMLMTVTAPRSVDLTYRGDSKRPEWTAAEAAQACQGMPPDVFAAMLYSYARADEMFTRLQDALVPYGVAAATELGIGPKVKREGQKRIYMADLCAICLLEERQPWRFNRASNQPNLRRVLMGAEEQTWRRKLSPVYEAIRGQYLAWLDEGNRRMRAKLRR